MFERALGRLGVTVKSWKGATALGERRGEPLAVNTAEHLEVLDNVPARTHADPLAIYLSSRLGILLPEELALDLRLVKPWLRARVVHPRVLSGPARAMCRRVAFAPVVPDSIMPETAPQTDLLTGVSIGGGRSISYVTTRALDAWSLSFEHVLGLGVRNVRSLLSPDDMSEVGGAPGVCAIVDPTLETGASASLVLDHLLPASEHNEGVLFSVPGDDATLVLPVVPGSGAKALAGLVQVTYAMAAERDQPLSEQIFWKRGGVVRKVPMTSIHEDGARRVHLEADGVVEELLRILGEIE